VRVQLKRMRLTVACVDIDRRRLHLVFCPRIQY
jgi:hypothetical protein